MGNKKGELWYTKFQHLMTSGTAIKEIEDYIISSEHLFRLISELTEREKKNLSASLELGFVKRRAKIFPDALFKKELTSLYQKSKHDIVVNQNLIDALSKLVETIHGYQQEDRKFSVEGILNDPKWWVYTFGVWHVYFAILLSGEPVDAKGLEYKLLRFAKAEHVEDAVGIPESVAKKKQNENGEQRKIEKLNRRIESLEVSLAKHDSAYKRLEREMEDVKIKNQHLESELDQAVEQTNKKQRQVEGLSTEVQTLHKRLGENKKQATALQNQNQELRISLNEQVDNNKQLIVAREELRERLNDQEIQVNQNSNLDRYMLIELWKAKATSMYEELNIHQEPNQRGKMMALLGFLEVIHNPEELLGVTEQNEYQDSVLPYIDSEELSNLKEKVVSYSGTFYRRDHGGYIQLETGNSFNITESMVYRLSLQHEAEVSCTAKENGLFDIELVFQGDDSHSPVQQHDGFLKFEQEHWYCYDMNKPELVYHIHNRDLVMLNLTIESDGLPCLFNLEEGSFIARIARVYYDDQTAGSKTENEASNPERSISSNTSDKKATKVKRNPYLEGCNIVVVGGQKKWFTDVVVETGANYIHENGERPDLVTSELRKASAVFLLITSTSHRASWETIEIAKTHNIPHFVIQGSKSNLRNLMWENKEKILSTRKNQYGEYA